MKKWHLVALLVLAASAPSAFAGVQSSSAILLWNEHPNVLDDEYDQAGLLTSLQSSGLKVEKTPGADAEIDFTTATLLVVPHGSAIALSTGQIQSIRDWTMRGGSLVFDADSPLAAAFKIQLSAQRPGFRLKNHLRKNDETRWPDKPQVRSIGSTAFQNSTVFYSLSEDGSPVVVGGRWGLGKVVYLSFLYDTISPWGTARINDLPLIVHDFLGLRAAVKSAQAEYYFDPSDDLEPPFNGLAERWAADGVRAIHISAWYDDGPKPFDYAAVIRDAHAQGVAVYAWFEWPHVSMQFWTDHPECREQTATLEDAHVDWRYLMNFSSAGCREQAFALAEKTLTKYDFDGVDVAEIYMEPLSGPETPNTFTPLNADARSEFKRQSGFDPIELFNPRSPHFWKRDRPAIQKFYDYRRRFTVDLTRRALERVQRINERNRRGWEVVLTLVEVFNHPELQDYIAVDPRANLRLAEELGATVEVQDGALDWAKAPARYAEIGSRYSSLLHSRSFLIDINVVHGIHDDTQMGFATDKQTGTELFELAQTAGRSTPRIIFYAHATLDAEDKRLLPQALAANTVLTFGDATVLVRSSFSVTYQKSDPRAVQVDGQDWPCQSADSVWLPRGAHRVDPVAQAPQGYDPLRFRFLSGDLRSCRREKDEIIVDADFVSRSWWGLKPGASVRLDVEPPTATRVLKDGQLAVPLGHHVVRLHD